MKKLIVILTITLILLLSSYVYAANLDIVKLKQDTQQTRNDIIANKDKINEKIGFGKVPILTNKYAYAVKDFSWSAISFMNTNVTKLENKFVK